METPQIYVFCSLLLQHLVDRWDEVGGRLERNLTRETVRAFSITNEELSQNKLTPDRYQASVKACKVSGLASTTDKTILHFFVFGHLASLSAMFLGRARRSRGGLGVTSASSLSWRTCWLTPPPGWLTPLATWPPHHQLPLAWHSHMITWWMVGALGLYADEAYLFWPFWSKRCA